MNEHKEVEARWIRLEPSAIIAKLQEIGAEKTGDYFFKEWIFQKPEWKSVHRRIRVRTDGVKNYLTYKANATWAVDSTEEVELEVSSAEKAVKFVKSADIPLVRYQEKKRQTYKFENIIFDLDTWPKVPFVVEIEAQSEEEVKKGASHLGLDWDKAVFEDQMVMHNKYFGIDLTKISDYRF